MVSLSLYYIYKSQHHQIETDGGSTGDHNYHEQARINTAMSVLYTYTASIFFALCFQVKYSGGSFFVQDYLCLSVCVFSIVGGCVTGCVFMCVCIVGGCVTGCVFMCVCIVRGCVIGCVFMCV